MKKKSGIIITYKAMDPTLTKRMDEIAWEKQRERSVKRLKKLGLEFKEFTCDECGLAKNGECNYAFDAYNTDGDCLGMK